MKKIITLLLFTALLFTMPSCESQEPVEYNTDIPATAEEIDGTWQCVINARYCVIIFSGNYYSMEWYNNYLNGEIYKHQISFEEGVIDVQDNVITLIPFEGEAGFGPLEAYWTDLTRTKLQLLPIGTFSKQ